MKNRVSTVCLAMILLISATVISASASELLGSDWKPSGEPVKSNDGRFEYYLDDKTGNALFVGSLEENITVLNIPDEIDNHKVVATIAGGKNINSITEVNYGKNIREVFGGGLSFSCLPTCKINLNEGLEVIYEHALWDVSPYDIVYDRIVFPTTLKKIETYGIGHNVKQIVFQSDPEINIMANSDTTGSRFLYEEKEVYFTGNALNVSADAFDIWWDGVPHGDPYEEGTQIPGNFTIYHKHGAKGFEKFAEHGYTVKEYTHEFWNDPIDENKNETLLTTNDETKSGEKTKDSSANLSKENNKQLKTIFQGRNILLVLGVVLFAVIVIFVVTTVRKTKKEKR